MLGILAGTASLHGQMIIKHPKKESVIEKERIFVTVLGKPGAKTWLYVNDVPADSGIIRIDGIHDFLSVDVPEGPVTLRAEAIGAGGRLFSAERVVQIVGRPDTMLVTPQVIEMPADGISSEKITVEVRDAWNQPINRLSVADVSISGGSIADADADSVSNGHQVLVNESRFELTVRAGREVGRYALVMEAAGLKVSVPIRYTTPLTDFILVGSVDGAVSAAESGDTNQEPKFTLADYSYQEGAFKDVPVSGRIAMYAKGALFERYQVTASFDSRRTRDNQLFRDLDPDKQYALYGDASSLTWDAQTQSKFYGRIERNESFLQVGDFTTGMRGTQFAKYDRSFNGLYSRFQVGKHRLTAFASMNDRSMKLDEIRGEGISGYYYLTESRITVNSDKIRLETRDRYHPEKVLKSVEKLRYSDYDINYIDGTLMFKQPVPSIDGGGNPVYIVAAYEYRGGAATSLISGGRYEGEIGAMKIGATAIMEEKDPANYYLYGADLDLPVGTWLKLKGEVARSRSSQAAVDNVTGSAWYTEVGITPHRAVALSGYYRNVDQEFYNPSQTGSRFEVGAEKYGGNGSISFGKFGRIKSEFYRQYSEMGTVNETQTRVTNAFYEYPLSDRTTARAGYEQAERITAGGDSSADRTMAAKMLKAELSHKWTTRFSSSLEYAQNLAEGTSTVPTGTAVGASYVLTKNVQLFLKQRFLARGDRRTQTVFGVESKVSRSTQLTGKYEIGGAAGEDLSRATIGLKNRWQISKDIALNLAYESTATLDSLEVVTPDHNALSIGYEYLPDKPWKASGKFELLQDKSTRKAVVTLGGEARVLDGLSAIGRIEYSGVTYMRTKDEVWNRGNYQFGLAYRPENSDEFNGIAKVQLLTDRNTHAAPRTELDRYIASAHAYWQASRDLEFGFRFAMRQLLDEETGFFETKTTTALFSMRAEYTFASRWSAGMDLRYLGMFPVDQAKTGFGVDINYLLRKNMQVGFGYIVKQLKDPDFSVSDYQYRNFYFRLRLKFSEDIFDWR